MANLSTQKADAQAVAALEPAFRSQRENTQTDYGTGTLAADRGTVHLPLHDASPLPLFERHLGSGGYPPPRRARSIVAQQDQPALKGWNAPPAASWRAAACRAGDSSADPIGKRLPERRAVFQYRTHQGLSRQATALFSVAWEEGRRDQTVVAVATKRPPERGGFLGAGLQKI
ncbi:MAG: hypothetical protein ACREFP_05320 [Acetobacteraceae bacterium]